MRYCTLKIMVFPYILYCAGHSLVTTNCWYIANLLSIILVEKLPQILLEQL